MFMLDIFQNADPFSHGCIVPKVEPGTTWEISTFLSAIKDFG